MTKLFVVGFPREMEEQALSALFEEFGDVTKVTIITDQQNGESKGYAFIDFNDEVGAKLAIREMDGFTLDGRTLHVKDASRGTATGGNTVRTTVIPPSSGVIKTERRRRPRLWR